MSVCVCVFFSVRILYAKDVFLGVVVRLSSASVAFACVFFFHVRILYTLERFFFRVVRLSSASVVFACVLCVCVLLDGWLFFCWMGVFFG